MQPRGGVTQGPDGCIGWRAAQPAALAGCSHRRHGRCSGRAQDGTGAGLGVAATGSATGTKGASSTSGAGLAARSPCGRHHREPVADVLQLPHVAAGNENCSRPRQRCIRNAFGLHPQLPRTLLQKVAGEHGHIGVALTQRGQPQADHVEAVEQVFTEPPSLTAAQVLVVAAITRTCDLTAAWPPTR